MNANANSMPPLGRLGARDEHVHFRLGSIANVVDERDLGLQVIGVAVVAVEKDLHLRRRRLLPAVFPRAGFGPDTTGQPHQGSERGRGRWVDEVAHWLLWPEFIARFPTRSSPAEATVNQLDDELANAMSGIVPE